MTQNIQWTKPVCQLDPDGLYIGQTQAELDIYTRDGSYIMPGGCIDAEPPETREGFVARRTGEAWEYVPDHRGQTAYRTDNGQAVVIETAGELSDGLTLEAPPSAAHEWNGKKWALSKTAAALLLEEAKSAKLAAIAAAAQAHVDAATGAAALPDFEVQSWAVQAVEARAWHENPEAPTPLLDVIAATRGIKPEILKRKAYEKAVAFEQITARAAGLRQAAEVKIKAAKTAEEVEAVAWAFDMPSETAGKAS